MAASWRVQQRSLPSLRPASWRRYRRRRRNASHGTITSTTDPPHPLDPGDRGRVHWRAVPCAPYVTPPGGRVRAACGVMMGARATATPPGAGAHASRSPSRPHRPWTGCSLPPSCARPGFLCLRCAPGRSSAAPSPW